MKEFVIYVEGIGFAIPIEEASEFTKLEVNSIKSRYFMIVFLICYLTIPQRYKTFSLILARMLYFYRSITQHITTYSQARLSNL